MMRKTGETTCRVCGKPVEVWHREDANPKALYPVHKDSAVVVHKFKPNKACDQLARRWVET